MKKRHFFGKALALCCLACALVLAGCDNPTRGNGNNGNNGHVPSWSGPHMLATWDDLDWQFDVAFGNGTFFVLGDADSQGNRIVKTSTDGINWTNAATRFSAFDWLGGIAFGGERFFAFGHGYGGGQLMVRASTNGTIWTDDVTECFSTYFHMINRIAYSGGRFFVFGVDDDYYDLVKTTRDFSTWYDLTYDFEDFMSFGHHAEIFYGAGRFFIWGPSASSAPLLKTSLDDGISWQPAAVTGIDWLRGISFGNDRFVAFGQCSSFYTLIKTSVNGTDWDDVTDVFGDPDYFWFNYISFAGGRFFAFGSRWGDVGLNIWGDNQALAKSSTDGINWTEEPFLAYRLYTGEGVDILGVFSGGGRTFVLADEFNPERLVVFVKD